MSVADELTEVASSFIPSGTAKAVEEEVRWFLEKCRYAASNGKFEFRGIVTKGDTKVVGMLVAAELRAMGFRVKFTNDYLTIQWGKVEPEKPSWWQRLFGKQLPKAKVVK